MSGILNKIDDLKLNPEFEYARQCLAYELFPGQVLPVPPADFNWDQFYQFLFKQSLPGHFYAIRATYQDAWPAVFCERLRSAYFETYKFGARYSILVKQILAALRTSGIQVIVLKGWALIHTLYCGDYGQRQFADIDLLIRPKDIRPAEAILTKLGYQGTEESWPGYSQRYLNARAYYLYGQNWTSGRAINIGLHWGLINNPSYNPNQINIDKLFERARLLVVEEQPVLELSPEDHVAYSCLHLGMHHMREETLFRDYEIATIIQKSGMDFDWKKVQEYAISWKVLLYVKKILNRVNGLWFGMVPAEVMMALAGRKPGSFEYLFFLLMEKTQGKSVLDQFIPWFTIPGLGKRISIMLEDIFPGPAYMKKRYGAAPGGLWPLLYFRRFFNAIGYLARKENR